jgi:hypothetical protein
VTVASAPVRVMGSLVRSSALDISQAQLMIWNAQSVYDPRPLKTTVAPPGPVAVAGDTGTLVMTAVGDTSPWMASACCGLMLAVLTTARGGGDATACRRAFCCCRGAW